MKIQRVKRVIGCENTYYLRNLETGLLADLIIDKNDKQKWLPHDCSRWFNVYSPCCCGKNKTIYVFSGLLNRFKELWTK